jgi:hypothetical protein
MRLFWKINYNLQVLYQQELQFSFLDTFSVDYTIYGQG